MDLEVVSARPDEPQVSPMVRTLCSLRTREHQQVPVSGRYRIDPTASSVEFVAHSFLVTTVTGHVPGVSGMVTIDEEPELSRVDVDLELATLSTGISKRDRHLRSPDFFDVERHPTITFRSTSVEAAAAGRWVVSGNLCICGVTRVVDLRVAFDGLRGADRVAFSSEAELDREDWGLRWRAPLHAEHLLISKDVRIKLDVAARRAR
jgi:polyisoprenoid-binding protein YceI